MLTGRRCANISTAIATIWPCMPRPCSEWRFTRLRTREKLNMIVTKYRAIPGRGRRKPDRLAQTAQQRLLVVLVRLRIRGPRLLSEASGPTDPKSRKASRLVKYLLNNRKHATYWNSTRDTAVIVEAFADYIAASGEAEPDLTLDIMYDGRTVKDRQNR